MFPFNPNYSFSTKSAENPNCYEWLYEIHQRLVTLEDENKKHNERFNEKGRKIEEFKGIIDTSKEREPRKPHVQPTSWPSFFDKKENLAKKNGD